MSGSQPVAVIGRYALYDEIASGGMATVHLGRLLGPVGFARTVAIKRLHQQYARDPEFVSMFLDEARLAARIRHPHVVPTLDVVALSGELFLVMDYVHGVTLSRLMRAVTGAGQRIPLEVATSIMVGALHGLHAAHEARSERGLPLGIVHRDVSPQNIIVGSDGLARVLDFGVAKASWRIQTTRDGQLKGKLAYMAPEQVNGGEVGPSTDVYSAAIVFWETLTNKRLFNRADSAAVLARFTKQESVPPPSLHHDGLPAGLDQIVLKALETDPSLRFSSAQEMADALEGVVPLASSSLVGRWLESAVHDELALHSRRIAEIEEGSSASVRPMNEESGSVQKMLASLSVAEKTSAPQSQVPTRMFQVEEPGPRSEISMTRSAEGSESSPPRRNLGVKLGVAAAALLFVGLLLFVALYSRSSADAPQVAAGEPLAAVAPAVALAPAPLPSSLPLSPAVAPPAASVEPAPLAAADADARTLTSVRPPARVHAASGCNPPYIVDARGIRHMKLACLR
jgi:serine/threonine-protein kinase